MHLEDRRGRQPPPPRPHRRPTKPSGISLDEGFGRLTKDALSGCRGSRVDVFAGLLISVIALAGPPALVARMPMRSDQPRPPSYRDGACIQAVARLTSPRENGG